MLQLGADRSFSEAMLGHTSASYSPDINGDNAADTHANDITSIEANGGTSSAEPSTENGAFMTDAGKNAHHGSCIQMSPAIVARRADPIRALPEVRGHKTKTDAVKDGPRKFTGKKMLNKKPAHVTNDASPRRVRKDAVHIIASQAAPFRGGEPPPKRPRCNDTIRMAPSIKRPELPSASREEISAKRVRANTPQHNVSTDCCIMDFPRVQGRGGGDGDMTSPTTQIAP